MRHGNETLGLLQFSDGSARRFTAEMNSFLENAARQITIALAQRQAQAALMASEQRLRDISEAAGEFICELDPDAKITFASDRITHVLGYTPAEVLGKTPFQFMPPEEVERTLPDLNERVRTRSGFREFEYMILNKDGQQGLAQHHRGPDFRH